LNILFIYSRQDCYSNDKPIQNQEQIQFGISYISSFLKQYGHNTKLFVITRKTKKYKLEKHLKGFLPSLICFTAVYSEYRFIAEIAEYIKNRFPEIFLLIGGVHPSLNPDECIKDSFDALCIGEGEYPTLELVEQLQNSQKPSMISNLWIKHDDSLEKNSTRPFLYHLDILPPPDRKMWERWIAEPETNSSVLLGRGCPFQCTYCCNHALKKIASGPYVRLRSPENILNEIKEVVNNYPAMKEIYLEVESITSNREFCIELCSALEHFNSTLESPLEFGTNIRISKNIDFNEIFNLLKKCNFKFINIGVESGSEKIRSQMLNREYSNEDVIKVTKLARKYDLKICFYNLLGIPGETVEDFNQTIEINRQCLPDWHFLSIFFPYPGTELYNLSKDRGLLKEPLDTTMERNRAVLDLPGFNKKQIQKNYVWFDYNVYKGKKPLHKILPRVIVSKIKTNSELNYFYRILTRNTVLKQLKNSLKRY